MLLDEQLYHFGNKTWNASTSIRAQREEREGENGDGDGESNKRSQLRERWGKKI